jgi:DNA polymerase-1
MKKLLLIDGNAMMHRAYHALPPLTNLKEEPVQMVYGFFSMLLNVLIDQEPTHLVVCFDSGAPTIRQSMFAGYHEHRPKLPDDFVSQIVLLHELLERMRVDIFELDGYEGDDLIGTIAERGVKDAEVVILTGDRDMLQLVNGRVKVLMPILGITKTVMFDEKAVEEKYGVKPSQFVDYKALIGDPSDGYPGVTGIGPKTASKLISEYGSFENLYKNLGELPERVGLKLATDAEQAALAQRLARIIVDVPIQFEIKKCACADFDIKSLLEGFGEQGFKSLRVRYEEKFGKSEEQLGLL